MSSPDKTEIHLLEPAHKTFLLEIARESIAHGLKIQRPLIPDLSTLKEAILAEERACFVTLERHETLRGCIGNLEARRPLIIEVAENAYNAAFHDPRFPKLTAEEWPDLQIKISILTLPERLSFVSEADLLRQIRPGTDGLILEVGKHRGTFLPAVWESLPNAQDFLYHLKEKAGLPSDYWSKDIVIKRYETESF